MESISSYEQFISAEYYVLFYLFILSAFVIIISINLLAKLVDRGSMAYLLSTRVSRVQIVMTQITVLISGLFIVHLRSDEQTSELQSHGYIVFLLLLNKKIDKQ